MRNIKLGKRYIWFTFDILSFILGFVIIYAITPAHTIVSYFVRGFIWRATDLEVPFNYAKYLQDNTNLFEKVLGMIGYAFAGDYSSISVSLLLIPIFSTFTICYIFSRICLFKESEWWLSSSLSLILSIAMVLNPFFMQWFSLPYMFFYPIVVFYILFLFYVFLHNRTQIVFLRKAIYFFILSFLIFGFLWDVSFHFIPYLIFTSLFIILISYQSVKEKLMLPLILILSILFSSLLSVTVAPSLLLLNGPDVTSNGLQNQLQGFWNNMEIINLITLTAGESGNYLISYTTFSIGINIFIPVLILLPLLVFKKDKYLANATLFYLYALSLGVISLYLVKSSNLIEYISFIGRPMEWLLLILRRPERTLLIMWIITWLVICVNMFHILAKTQDRCTLVLKRKIKVISVVSFLSLFLIFIFIGGIIIPTYCSEKKLEGQIIKPMHKDIFVKYLNFLRETNNVSTGKSYFLPFYMSTATDNRLNYKGSLFYSSSFGDDINKENYVTFLIILNETLVSWDSHTSTDEKTKTLKRFVIGTKLLNITKIGICSPIFIDNEFQNWRMHGNPRIHNLHVWGDPEMFKNIFFEMRNHLTNMSEIKSMEILRIKEFDGYNIVEMPSEQVYESCILHVPIRLKEQEKIKSIEYLTENLPNTLLGNLTMCREIKMLFKTKSELIINFDQTAILMNNTQKTMPLRNLSNNVILFKNITDVDHSEYFETDGNFSVWYLINKEKLKTYYDNETLLCVFMEESSNQLNSTWTRVLDKDGNVTYNFDPSCYYIDELISSDAHYIAISQNIEGFRKFRIMAEIKNTEIVPYDVFYTDDTPDLEIKIEYEPQRWFYIGAVVSLATLLLCVIYLIKSRTGTPDKHTQKPGKKKEEIRLPDISQHTKNITGAFRQILPRKSAEIKNINAQVTRNNKKEWKYKYKPSRKQKEIILGPRPTLPEENIDRKIKEIKERLMKYEKMKKKTPSH